MGDTQLTISILPRHLQEITTSASIDIISHNLKSKTPQSIPADRTLATEKLNIRNLLLTICSPSQIMNFAPGPRSKILAAGILLILVVDSDIGDRARFVIVGFCDKPSKSVIWDQHDIFCRKLTICYMLGLWEDLLSTVDVSAIAIDNSDCVTRLLAGAFLDPGLFI
jgi:hypothetical protein